MARSLSEWRALESAFREAVDPHLVDEIILRQLAVRARLRRLLGWPVEAQMGPGASGP